MSNNIKPFPTLLSMHACICKLLLCCFRSCARRISSMPTWLLQRTGQLAGEALLLLCQSQTRRMILKCRRIWKVSGHGSSHNQIQRLGGRQPLFRNPRQNPLQSLPRRLPLWLPRQLLWPQVPAFPVNPAPKTHAT